MLKIRLRRGGATHAPFYRIVVSDSLKTPSAATVEQVGHYDPKKNPADVKIDREQGMGGGGEGAPRRPGKGHRPPGPEGPGPAPPPRRRRREDPPAVHPR